MMDYFVYFGFGFVLGWALCEYRLRSMIQRIMKKIRDAHGEDDEIEEGEDTVAVKLEKHGDTVFVYNRDTEAFITQVKSKKEFFSYCENNFRGKMMFMRKEDMEMLDTL